MLEFVPRVGIHMPFASAVNDPPDGAGAAYAASSVIRIIIRLIWRDDDIGIPVSVPVRNIILAFNQAAVIESGNCLLR